MNGRLTGGFLIALTLLLNPPGAQGSDSSSLMQISRDGTLLVCTNRDNGTATGVDLKTRTPRFEIKLGKKPEGITFLGNSHECAACVYGDDKVVFFNADSGEVRGAVDVFDEPYGIVATSDGTRVYACLEYPGKIVEINPETRTIAREFAAGQFPRGLAITADDSLLYVTEYLTGTARALDRRTGEETHVWPGLSSDNLARQIVLHPTLNRAYFPHIRSKIEKAHGDGSIFPYVAILDTKPEPDKQSRKRIPMDSFRGTLVTANPWECEISPDGQTLYVVFSGTDDLFVCNILDDGYREITYRDYLQTGHNPRAVKATPDGESFYVYDALDFQVVEYNASTLRRTATIPVCKMPYSEEMRLGKVLFYTALPPMTTRRWISCSSCHPDGDPDGRTWQNPEGKRNTPSLVTVAWTHPLHWSADRDETQDFEHTIRGPLMQGRGLVRGRIYESLDLPNGGLSEELDALALYNNSHPAPMSPYAKNGLSEAAQRGKKIFFAKSTRCAECHKGPYYSDSNPAFKAGMHDVGTGRTDTTEKMGTKYDTPTLLGLYRTAPYLHDGQAQTLEELFTTYNPEDQHGKTSQLSADDIRDLVEFLKALPYEDPEPEALRAGLKKVEK